MFKVRRLGVLAVALVFAGTTAASCSRGGQPSATPTPAFTSALSDVPSSTPTPVASRPTPAPTRPTPTRPAPSQTTSRASFPASLAGKDIDRIPTSRKVVALTFDAGANADGVPAILNVLASQHVTATFFLTGDFTQAFPESARSIVRAGHRLGNHSVSHPHFPTLTNAQIGAQLTGTENRVHSVTGATTRPLFRFPYGDRTAQTIAVVNQQGYVAVRWTVDSLGWQGTSGGRSVASVTDRVLAAAQPGEIVLMHVGSHPEDRSTLDAAALPGVIAGLRARGYTFVTLDVLLR